MTQEHEIVTQEQAEAMDDMGSYMEAQELEQAMAAGRVQAGMGGVL